jgi:hypothetical protein
MPREVTRAAKVLVASAVQNVFSNFRFFLQADCGTLPIVAIY